MRVWLHLHAGLTNEYTGSPRDASLAANQMRLLLLGSHDFAILLLVLLAGFSTAVSIAALLLPLIEP